MTQSVADFLRTRGVNPEQDSGDPIDRIIKRRGSDHLRPVVRAIYGQESSSGAADTSRPNYAGANGPMQVIPGTFEQMKREGRIPADYQFDNPDHTAEAGVAYIEKLAEKFGGDPRKIAMAYYGGPGAVGHEDRRDPKNPKAPTVGQYGDQVVGRLEGNTGPFSGRPSRVTGNRMSVSDYVHRQREDSQGKAADTYATNPTETREPGAAVQSAPEISWAQVAQHPNYINGDETVRQQFREAYWREVIAPRVPPGKLDEYRAEFDRQVDPGVMDKLIDTGKSFAGGAVQGVGMAVRGIGEGFREGGQVLADGINAVAGTELEAVNPLDSVAGAIDASGQKIMDSRTIGSQIAQQGSTPEGEILDPSTWSAGTDPSVYGYIQQGAAVLGQFAPMLAAAYATRGRSLAGQTGVMGALGGAQGGGAAAQQARETIQNMTEDELMQNSSYYRQVRERLGHEQAKALTAKEAEKWAFRLTLPVSALGGSATGLILSPAARLGAGLVAGSRIGNAAVTGVLSGLEEGSQEVGEQYATQRGINVGAGTNLNPWEDSVANFVLGAMGGAGGGAIAGATTTPVARERAPEATAAAPADGSVPVPAGEVLGTPQPEITVADAQAPDANVQPGAATSAAPDPLAEAEQLIAAVDAGGIPLNPRKVRAVAETFGLEVKPRERTTVIVQRIREAVARAKGQVPASSTPRKQPWQQTRQEFTDDAAYQGVNAATDESNPSYWFTDQPEEARTFAEGDRGDGTAPRRSEPRIDIASKQDLGAEWKSSERPSGSNHAYTGESKKRPIVASIPLEAASDPHRYLVEQALERGENVPPEVLADYPDLAGRSPAPEPNADADPAAGKRALYQHFKGTGLSDEDTAHRVLGWQERVNEAGVPHKIWLSPSGTIGMTPANQPSPLKNGRLLGTLHPENADSSAGENASSADSEMVGETDYGQAAIDAAAHEAATSPINDLPEPTDGQKEAGNYKKGHVRVQGLDISIENPKGSERKGTDGNGKPWAVVMPGHYGYIKGTKGKDKDHLDVTLGEAPDDTSRPIFVFNQSNASGGFDEHKILIGYADADAARKAYRDSFSGKLGQKMENNLKGIAKYTPEQFKDWLANGDHTKPALPPTSATPETTKAEPPTEQQIQKATDRILAAIKKAGMRGATMVEALSAAGLDPESDLGDAAWQRIEPNIGEVEDLADTTKTVIASKSARTKGPVHIDAETYRQELAKIEAAAAESEAEPAAEPDIKARYAELTREYNGLVVQYRDASEAGRAKIKPRMDELLRELRSIEGEHQKAGEAQRAEKWAEDARKKYGEMPVGTKVGMIGYGPDSYWVKVGENARGEGNWQRVMGGRRDEVFKRDSEMEGEAIAAEPAMDRPKFEVIDNGATNPGEYIVRGDGTNLARFSIGAKGTATKVKFFFESQQTRDYAQEAIDKFISDRANAKPKPESGPSATAPAAPSARAAEPRPMPDRSDPLFKQKNDLRQLQNALDGPNAPNGMPWAEEPTLRASYEKSIEDLKREIGGAPAVTPNKVFTDDGAEKARALIRAKLGQVNAGLDPELLQAGIYMAGYHVEKGARTFAAYAKAMVEDLGDLVKPYLKSWYMAVRYDPRTTDDLRSEMSPAAEVDTVDVESVLAPMDTVSDQEDTQDHGDTSATNEVPAGNPRGDREDAAAGDGHREPLDAGLAEDGSGAAGRGGLSGSPDGSGAEGAGGVQPAGEQSPGPARDSRPVRPKPGASGPVEDFDLADEDIGKGGLQRKYRDNVAAIRVLRTLETEGRPATAEERSTIARYVGWGALKGVFDPQSTTWAKQHAELKELLTDAEWKAARASTLNAHFTSKPVVSAIHNALRRMGFTGGRVLEPSVGVGNFFGLMPADVRAASSLHGVELDPLTAKIATALYPSAKIVNSGFQDFDVPSGFFDVAIGNPPFGNETIVDSARSPYSGFSIHNYFFAKSLDKLRPGGLLAMVVSHSFMDSKADAARKWIAEHAELVAGVRLPNTAFKENAGTEVVTDILVFRKLAPGEKPSNNYLSAAPVERSFTNPKTGEPVKVTVGKYFADDPSRVLGTESAAGKMYRQGEYTVEPDGNWQKKLEDWADGLPDGLYTPIDRTSEMQRPTYSVPDGTKVGSFFLAADGSVKQRGPDSLGERTALDWTPGNGRALERMKAMIELRDLLREQMRLERSPDSTEKAIEANRKRLNGRYDAFVSKNGYLNSPVNRRIFLDDTESPLLQALEADYDKGVSAAMAEKEDVPPREPSAKKADILQRRVMFPPSDDIRVATATDALLSSLNYRGRIDPDYMASVYGKPIEEIEAELGDAVYRDPQAGLVPADEYLSGDVKTKLAEAEQAAKGDPAMQRNVDALRKVIPKDKLPSEISAQLGANFIPADVFTAFAKHVTGAEIPMNFIPATGTWSFGDEGRTDPALNRGKYGTDKMPAVSILQATFLGKAVVVKETTRNPDGSTSTYVLEAETELAREKQAAMKAEWQSWLWSDPARADLIASLYNEKMNRIVPRKYDGSHLTFPGMSPAITLLAHQKNGVWRGLQSRRVLYDHVVGAGKTYQMATLAMEMRRLGIARKPMFAVPNHLTLQWRQEFYKLYPGAYILVAEPDDFTKGNRERFFSKIATGDWDAVVVGHSSLVKIPLPEATERNIFDEQIAELSEAIEEAKRTRGDRNIIRDMEKIRSNLQAKMQERANKRGTRDRVLSFDELGVDALFVDEMHEFKNLFYNSTMDRTAGMGNPAGSTKAFDMFVKVRWLVDMFGKKAPLVTATGTPVSNSLVEMYNIQRYMQYPELKELALHTFDAWARQFGQVEQVYEVAPSGTGYRQSTRFAKFANLPALMALYGSFADTITLDDLVAQEAALGKRFPIPKVSGGKPVNVVADRSPAVANFMGVPRLDLDEAGRVQFEFDPEGAEFRFTQNPQTGKWSAEQRPKGMDHWHQVGRDYETEEDAKVGLALKGMTPKISVDPGSILGQFDRLRDLTKATKGKINALSLTGLANKAGLDYRLIDPNAPDFPGSKINLAIDRMMEVYRRWSKDKGTQLVFCDLSVPLSARAHLAHKDRLAYVRGDDGLLTHVRASLNAVKGYEYLPYLLVSVKNGNQRTVTVYDAASGLRVRSGFASRDAANEWARTTVENPEARQRWLDGRAKVGEITEDDISDYNNSNDINTEEVPYITRADIAGVSGASAFSVYDDIKSKLVAQGVPEREIAFIHDYDTPTAKAKLFASVNAGRVRFLLGSTPKMGAGTNVQERLVGLHHIDAPWRPSDLEQREGRIIRRGNKLYERDPDGFEVGIYRYATSQTYDTRRWQILEHKARGIEQLRKYDGTLNEIDDIEGEAANSADMKAAASGDPLILEETRLRNDVRRLENVQMAHADARTMARRRSREAEVRATQSLPKLKEEYRKIVETVAKHPLPEDPKAFVGMRLNGKSFTEKDKAVAALQDEFGALLKDDANSNGLGIKYHVSGEYRGIPFTLTLERNWQRKRVLTLEIADHTSTYHLDNDEKFSPSGALVRMNNAIELTANWYNGIDARIAEEKKNAAALAKQAEEPFAQAAELEEVRGKFRTVQRALMAKGPAIPDKEKPVLERATAKQRAALRAAGLGDALKEISGNEVAPDSDPPAVYSRRGRPTLEDWNSGEGSQTHALHITGTANLASIAKDGLRAAGDGYVYLWDSRLDAESDQIMREAGMSRGLSYDEAGAATDGYVAVDKSKIETEPDPYTGELRVKGDIPASALLIHNGTEFVPAAQYGSTLSRDQAAPQEREGASVAQVYRWLKDQPLFGHVHVVKDVAGLRRMVGDMAVFPDTEGYYRLGDDKVYLVASMIPDLETAKTLYRHEVEGHLAVELYGDVTAAVADILAARKNPAIAALWAEVAKTQPNLDPRIHAREVIALVAERGSKFPAVDRLIGRVRALLRKLGVKLDFSEADVRAIVARAARAATKDAARRRVTAPGPAVNRRGGEDRPHATVDHSGLLDAAFKHLGGKQFAKLVTSPIYDRLIRAGGQMVPEKVKQGLVSDYGLPEPYLDAKIDKQAAVNKVLRKTRNMIDMLAGLDREQSRIAYLWMNEKPDTDLEAQLLAQLPEDSRAVVQRMKELVDDLGRQAVDVGLLSQDSYDRNRMAYLHRSYQAHMAVKGESVQARHKKAASVRADNYKGRGLRDDVDPTTLGEFEKGDKRLRIEKRGPRGGLQEVRYIRTDEAVPDGWTEDGEWEIRWLDQKPGVGEVAGLWRDLTPEERQRLGEVEEVRFAFAKTMLNAIHDIENQKFLAWVSGEYAVDPEEIDEGQIVEASDGFLALKTYSPDQYVRVPTTGIPKTPGLKKYGALAGKVIPAVMWNDVRNTMALPESDIARFYDKVQRAWKISKTALSPTVHVNNVMSNFILADVADVRVRDIRRAAMTWYKAKRGDDEAADLLARYEDSGAEAGSFHAMELHQDIIKPLLDELENEQDESLLGQLSAAHILALLKAGDVRNAAKAIGQKGGIRQTLKAGKSMIDLYRSEDTMFRFAKFLREVEAGRNDRDAGKAARDAFLNYEINAPFIQAARRTVLPFIAFSYRAIPKMLETAAHKPWKLAKYFAAGAALNSLAYAMLGMGADDEDKERGLLPEELQGRVLGVFPRLVRLPWNDANGAPTFLDVRRWVPAGDIMDTMGSHSTVPLPNWLSVGGPLAFALEAYANKSMFTGQPIVKDSDTAGQKAAKFADYAFKWAAPNLPLPNPANFVLPAGRNGDEPRFIDLGIIPGIDRDQLQTYSWTGVMRAGTGREDAFGRESGSVGQALASSLGFKARSYPTDVAKKRVMGETRAAADEINQNIRQLSKERARGGLTEKEYRERLEVELTKKRNLYTETATRLGATGQPR